MSETFGLYWVCATKDRSTPVELASVSATANIVDMAAKVTITQTYTRPNYIPEINELSYAFPLDDKSAVCGFELTVDGRDVEGVVKEKLEAKAEYHQAVSQGYTAALMEEYKADVFRIKLGNLPRNAREISTTITYLVELKMEVGSIKFFVPTFIGARYTPPGCTPTVDRNPNYVPIVLTLEWDMPSRILEVSSPTHPDNVQSNVIDSHATITIRSNTRGGDMVVLCRPEIPHEARACLETSEDGSRVMMVTFVPRLELKEQKCEYIFVVDRSGSMGTGQMDKAKSALQYFLRSLPEDSYVNVVGFGTSYDVLFPKRSARYSERSLEDAAKYAQNMKSNFGGTQILQPLQHIYDILPTVPRYSRQIFLLTDGQISNTQDVIALVAKHAPATRMFGLGIGTGVSHHLMNGIARAGMGTAEYVTDNERMLAATIKQLKASQDPCIQKTVIDWLDEKRATFVERETVADKPAEKKNSLLGYITPSKRVSGILDKVPATMKKQTPFRSPPIFNGDRFLSYFFMDENDSVPTKIVVSVTIRGENDGEPLVIELPIVKENTYEGTDIVHTLAARSMIQDLEESDSYLGTTATVEDDQVKSEVVRLGVKYRLSSKHTSYVVVDRSTKQEVPILHHACRKRPDLFSSTPMMMVCKRLSATGTGRSANRSLGPMSATNAAPMSCMPMAKLRTARVPRRGHLSGGGGSVGIVPKGGMFMAGNERKKKKRSIQEAMKEQESVPMTRQRGSDIPDMCKKMDICDDKGSIDDMEEDESPGNKQAAVLSKQENMDRLVAMQAFNGSFNFCQALLALLDVSEVSVRDAFKDVEGVSDLVMSTALALTTMQFVLVEFEDTLKLIESKARLWLISNCQNVDKVLRIAKHTLDVAS
ncbi:hypothetical protein SARC_05725 [Sphaeroforma arctica JP610]|uniref:VWFA domain-containing protein n=1 Tax=Sphaeroforma arctica JP610 TaxID=667725 RepID=A0A0L0FZI7_9EUKA|nr:hypothetical protein SARC_05725 [Sphaeroforma arctica JP610]KNC81976.1 hypothetical protein SARC_05725 [Sphaeroforma arctica JP610]|eukprot:XP_014155878.1 hypothetical protein SARC_05725 [Sphaeroforma arctica JP610]